MCDWCNKYEHLACRGLLHPTTGDHQCLTCGGAIAETKKVTCNYVARFSALSRRPSLTTVGVGWRRCVFLLPFLPLLWLPPLTPPIPPPNAILYLFLWIPSENAVSGHHSYPYPFFSFLEVERCWNVLAREQARAFKERNTPRRLSSPENTVSPRTIIIW